MKLSNKHCVWGILFVLFSLPGYVEANGNCPSGKEVAVSVSGPKYVEIGKQATYTCTITQGESGGTYSWSIGRFQGTSSSSSITVTAPDTPSSSIDAETIQCTYTKSYPEGDCTASASVKVTVVKINILSVNGTDNNGTLQVTCSTQPPGVNLSAYEYKINGALLSSGSCSISSGSWGFSIGQQSFVDASSTFLVRMKMPSNTWCQDSMTVTRTPGQGSSGNYTVTTYFAVEGIGLKNYEHMVAEDKWYKLTYSVSQSGKTTHVGSTEVRLDFGDATDYNAVSWGEEHKYVNTDGDSGITAMTPGGGSGYYPIYSRGQTCNANLWLNKSALRGVSEVKNLEWSEPGSVTPGMPITNGDISVPLN